MRSAASLPHRKILCLCKIVFRRGALWSAIGASKDQLMINTMTILLGRHVRVGMEDTVYFRKGELAKSKQLKIRRSFISLLNWWEAFSTYHI
jgi:uncharacterized protein (DUF849 family)